MVPGNVVRRMTREQAKRLAIKRRMRAKQVKVRGVERTPYKDRINTSKMSPFTHVFGKGNILCFPVRSYVRSYGEADYAIVQDEYRNQYTVRVDKLRKVA